MKYKLMSKMRERRIFENGNAKIDVGEFERITSRERKRLRMVVRLGETTYK